MLSGPFFRGHALTHALTRACSHGHAFTAMLSHGHALSHALTRACSHGHALTAMLSHGHALTAMFSGPCSPPCAHTDMLSMPCCHRSTTVQQPSPSTQLVHRF